MSALHLLVACAVCFGQNDSPMAVGTNMGIFLMLGITAGVLAAFASFFVYLVRRARQAEAAELGQAAQAADRAKSYVATEGTA